MPPFFGVCLFVYPPYGLTRLFSFFFVYRFVVSPEFSVSPIFFRCFSAPSFSRPQEKISFSRKIFSFFISIDSIVIIEMEQL